MATVDQTSIRGFKLPHECVSSQACLGLESSVGNFAGSKWKTRIAYRSALPPAEQARGVDALLRHRWSHFLADRPDEAGQLSRDGGDHDRGLLALG